MSSTWESVQLLTRPPQVLNGQNQAPNTSWTQYFTCHTLTWRTSRPSHDTSFQLVTLSHSCKYSADQSHARSRHSRQFNTNYFHLTGSAIKTVSPSDWDSCLQCGSSAVTPIPRNYLCFAPAAGCRQHLPPITPNCSLANFPPRRPNRHRNPTRLQSKLRFVQMRFN